MQHHNKCTTSTQQQPKIVEIPFVRLETPASVMIGTLGMSPFIVVPEDCSTKKIQYYKFHVQ